MTYFTYPTYTGLKHIFENLRDLDKTELQATDIYPDNETRIHSTLAVANSIFNIYSIMIAQDVGKMPIAFASVTKIAPQTAVLSLVATNGWERISFDTHKFIKRIGLKILKRNAIKRAEVRVWRDYELSVNWLKRLGFKYECSLTNFAALPFHQYVYLINDHPQEN